MRNSLNNVIAALHLGSSDRPVDALDILYTQLVLGKRATRTIGDGARRQRERLAEQRRKDMPEPVATRQRKRRETMLRMRQVMTVAKREMPAIPGGPSILRTVDDIQRVLG